LTSDGRAAGEFVEQAPYLEWLRSSYPQAGVTCQSCHVPPLRDRSGGELAQYIAHTPGGRPFPPTRPRAPFGLHTFSGANAQVLAMLRERYTEKAAVLDRSAELARRSLSRALGLKLAARLSGGALEAEVEVRNHTGHKLPTGYPSRRLWLHVTVADRRGAVIFESGGLDERTGEIRGLAGTAGPQPHRRLITDPDQAAVYEAEMHDRSGNPTITLLRGAGFAKDNRILPHGYDSRKPLPAGIASAAIAPAGVDGDADFLPGSDTVRFRIPAPAGGAPFRIVVEALFQSVKPAHLRGLEAARSAEEEAFLKLYPRQSAPVVAARQAAEVAAGP
jgi:hypothetical protein